MPSLIPMAKAQAADSNALALGADGSIELFITALLVIIALSLIIFRLARSQSPAQGKGTVNEDRSTPSAENDRKPEDVKAPLEVEEILQQSRSSWLSKLKEGLTKSRMQLTDRLASIINKKSPFDEHLLEEIHEVLFRSDMGSEMADFLVDKLRRNFSNNEAPSWNEVNKVLNETIKDVLLSDAETESISTTPSQHTPRVILVVGVNGVGKTTSIGKLAAHFVAEGKSVLLCAGDTFRAAAIEQLQVWGQKLGVPVISQHQGADPASVAFDAVKSAKAKNVDVLIIDTAGRLHNKQELMDELAKIKRVIGKEHDGAPHDTFLVIDATTGQNAFQQVQAFKQIVQLTGLIVTKLDGTAKGGVIIGIRRKFNLPIKYIGVGEKSSDLRTFNAEDYVKSLFPVETGS